MNGNRKIRIGSLLITLSIFLLVSSSCGGGASTTPVATSELPVNPGAEEQPTPTLMVQAPTSTPLAEKIYKIGDIIPIGNSVLVVLGWENVSAENLDSSSQPKEGNKFVAVELVIVNNNPSTIRVNEMRQVSMVDDTGQKYETDYDAFVAIGISTIDGELAPGERVRGKPGFQIPENTQALQFIFDASDFGAGKITVDLGAEPVTVEPPAELAGEASLQTYNVGDVVTMGTATLTVHGVQYPAGDQSNKPREGYKFLVVDLTIENKGAAEISFSMFEQPSLKDSSGQKYYFSQPAAFASGSSFFGGIIAPGEKLGGQVGFEVPENASGFIFVFDARTLDSEQFYVALP